MIGTFKGFAKIRRGFLEHIRVDSNRKPLSDKEVRLFVAFLMMAVNSGEDAGLIEGTTAELAELSGFGRRQTFSETVKKLCDKGYVRKVQGGRNQHEKQAFRVVNFESDGATETVEATETGTPAFVSPRNSNCLPTQQKLLGHITKTVGPTAVTDTKHNDLQALIGERGKRVGDGSAREAHQESFDLDEEAMLKAIVEAYPKKTAIGRARAAMRDAIANGREGHPAKWLAKVIAAAQICSRFPVSEQGFLPSLPDFVADDWATDWNSQLEIVLAKSKRTAPTEETRRPMSPDEEIARMRRINARAARTL